MTKEEWIKLIKDNKEKIKSKMKEALELSIEWNDDFKAFICDDGDVLTDRHPYDYAENLICEKIEIIEWDWYDSNIPYYLENWDSYWAEFYYNEFLEKIEKDF